jgi:hypothetical protein
MPHHTRHRRWVLFDLIVVIAAGAVYFYATRHGRAALVGLSGGSSIGLTFGIAALALIFFAGLRGLRRWMPGTIGSADFWAGAHLWLGTLALPLAWMHGGFAHGGPLTRVMMWVFYMTVAFGAAAAVLRHYLSHPTTGGLPQELIDLPVDDAVAQLAAEADKLMSGSLAFEEEIEANPSGGGVAVISGPVLRAAPLKELYERSVQPYLGKSAGGGILAHHTRATRLFRRCRTLIPDRLHMTLSELERICDTCRRLRSRQHLAQWVDVCMLVHVPLASALIVLAMFHSVMSLRY